MLPRTTAPDGFVRRLSRRVVACASRTGLRAVELLNAERDALRERIPLVNWSGLDEMPYAATISVWGRWFMLATAAVEVTYRPPSEHATTYAGLVLALGALNGALHYRVITKRPIVREHVLGIGAFDIVVITAAVIVHGGFASFVFLAYYPVVGVFALLGSAALALVSTTIVAGIYTAVCLTVDPRLDMDAREEKELFWRIVVMFAIVVSVAMISRFERSRRMDAVERERTLQRERVELSQTIHDTTAQAAYMIGLGLDTAIQQADDSNTELAATLAATAALAKSTMWEIRRPIEMGPIFEGRLLGHVLRSQIATFTTITSVPVEMVQTGTEPPLATETRTRLFAIVHNALANAFRHAQANQVQVTLDFEAERIRLSISDDGVGLPDDYAERGRGFSGMQADAERMGGTLIIETGGRQEGTSVTCIIPFEEA